MSICKFCGKEMMRERTRTCGPAPVLFPDGETFPAVKHQNEEGNRCHDCNVAPGGFHHPGCSVERCPRCGGQLITCGCLDECLMGEKEI